MKKLMFLVFLILPTIFYAQDYKKNLINDDDKIIIQDSSAIDSAYAPIYIFKDQITWIGKSYDDKDGAINIYINNSNPATTRRMQYYSDISLDYKYFNGYDSNEQILDSLLTWTEEYHDDTMYTVEFLNSDLQFGTRRVVNTIDTICSDSAYVYMSIANAPGNTNNVQYKGAYGVWQVLGSSSTVNVGDRITVIGDFYIMSTATTDTAYIFIQKQ